MKWEADLITFLQENLASFNATFSKLFAFFGSEEGLLLLMLIAFFCWKKESGKKLILTVVPMIAWMAMIKAVVKRPRPYMEYPETIKPLALVDDAAGAQDITAQGYSFPSMHSGTVAASYFTLAKDIKEKWATILAAFLTIAVGISRVAAGMHYPSDVLAGWLIGFAAIGIYSYLEKHIENENQRSLILLISTIPGLLFVRTQEYFTILGMMIGSTLAFIFEEKYVNFQPTGKILFMILRVAGAFAIFLVLNTLLKMPFDPAYLASDNIGALLIRTFVIIGVYPLLFRYFEKNK